MRALVLTAGAALATTRSTAEAAYLPREKDDPMTNPMNAVERLEPCPFCGSAPSLRADCRVVGCTNGECATTCAAPVEVWNTRLATRSQLEGDVELLSDVLDFLGGVDDAADLRARILTELRHYEIASLQEQGK